MNSCIKVTLMSHAGLFPGAAAAALLYSNEFEDYRVEIKTHALGTAGLTATLVVLLSAGFTGSFLATALVGC
jgi:hypothetical protein